MQINAIYWTASKILIHFRHVTLTTLQYTYITLNSILQTNRLPIPLYVTRISKNINRNNICELLFVALSI